MKTATDQVQSFLKARELGNTWLLEQLGQICLEGKPD